MYAVAQAPQIGVGLITPIELSSLESHQPMGLPQSSFLAAFEAAFRARSGINVQWAGGQVISNTAAFPVDPGLRRLGRARKGESFELADLAANVGSWRVVIEFESGAVPLSNLLKYWPYVRGELGSKPEHPLLICHFSDWWSYATRRDLWRWTLEQMKKDPECIVKVDGRQFDHWGNDELRRSTSVAEAIDWIVLKCIGPDRPHIVWTA